jgi:hypothetical protein
LTTTSAALVAGIQIVSGFLSRILLHLARIKPFSLRTLDRKRILSIGSEEEAAHAFALLWQTHFGLGRQKQMTASEVNAADGQEMIRRKIRKHGIDEVVFCAKDLKWGRIIELMEQLKRTGVMFKIAQPAREFIIGPSSIESVNDLLILEEHAVNSASARRRKRMLDILLCVFFLITLPLGIWFVVDRPGFLANLAQVLRGQRSWVGYAPMKDPNLRLPRIRPGVLDPVTILGLKPSSITVRRVNLNYAKDYRVLEDLRWVLGCFSGLGRRGR